jgi:hypothetical protein
MTTNKVLVLKVDEHTRIYRDTRNGIAWVEDGRSGTGHSCHPNIDRTGSVRLKKARGDWDKKDRVVESHGFKYNIDVCLVSENDPLDALARAHCLCGGRH